MTGVAYTAYIPFAMANLSASKKDIRVSARRKVRNYAVRKEVRQVSKSFLDLVKKGYNGGMKSGFTIIEMAVVLAIITFISAAVLVSFTGLHEGAAVNRSARELALAIRRAQNMSFAVTRVDTATGPRIPPAVGVRFTVGSPIYFIFADMVRDNMYADTVLDNAVDAKVSNAEGIFEGGIKVASLLYYDSLGGAHVVPVAHVIFVAPEATVVLTDAAGNSLGDILEIGLASASGNAKRTVVVRTSGQVSIK